MSDGHRRKRPTLLEAFLCILALLGLCALIYATGRTFGVEAGRDQVAAREHYETAKQDALDACAGREGPGAIECVTEGIEAAQGQSESRQDLYAQQDMARWAFWMLVVTALTFAATAVGVWLVKRTLDATLEAVKDTGEATGAMQAANRIAAHAQRPWIKVSASLINYDMGQGAAVTFDYSVKFENIGQMVAENFQPEIRLIPMGRDFLDEMKVVFDQFPRHRELQDTAIIPSEQYSYAGQSGYNFESLPWEIGDGFRKDCYIILLIMCRYRAPGEAEWRLTMQGHSIGHAISVVDNRNFIYDRRRKALTKNFAVKRIGRSRAT